MSSPRFRVSRGGVIDCEIHAPTIWEAWAHVESAERMADEIRAELRHGILRSVLITYDDQGQIERVESIIIEPMSRGVRTGRYTVDAYTIEPVGGQA